MAYNDSKYMLLVWGCAGAPTSTEFMFIGCGANTKAQETSIAVGRAVTAREARVWTRVAPGPGITDTYTLNITTVGSACAPTVVTTATTGTWSGAVEIADDDTLSVEFTSSGATAADDCFFTLLVSYQD